MQQQQQGTVADWVSSRMNIGMMVSRSWATPIEVFIHRGIGARYLGLNAIFGGAIPPIFITLLSNHDSRPLMCFWFAYVALVYYLVCFRKASNEAHSFYDGTPWLFNPNGKTDELTFKRIVEPFWVMLAGLAICALNLPFGMYLVGGAISMNFVNSIAHSMDRRRELDLHDAVFEQERLAEAFRRRRNQFHRRI